MPVTKNKHFTLQNGKLTKTIPLEEEILDFILYNKDLGNSCNKINFKLLSIDKRYQENNGIHFKSGGIALFINFSNI